MAKKKAARKQPAQKTATKPAQPSPRRASPAKPVRRRRSSKSPAPSRNAAFEIAWDALIQLGADGISDGGFCLVDLSTSQAADGDLELLRPIPVQVLCLDDRPITDAGLKILEGIATLESLSLSGTRVTPAGVKAFRAARPDVEVATKAPNLKGKINPFTGQPYA